MAQFSVNLDGSHCRSEDTKSAHVPLASRPVMTYLGPVFRVVPECAFDIMEREVQLFRCHLAGHAKDTIVGYQGFEFAAERVSLNPVHHIPAIRGTEGNGAFRVNVIDVLLDVVEAQHKVFVRQTTPLALDGICEGLTVRGA